MGELFPERVETERLRLEPLTVEAVDVRELYRHCRAGADRIDEVTEYLSWEPHRTPKDTLEFVEAVTEARESDDGATYVVVPKESEDGAGEIAGTTGLSVDWDCRTAELGIWLRPPFWGRGYSGERAGALLSIAFERLDLEAVVITVQWGNEQSRRAVEKYVERFGGRHEGLLRNLRPDPEDGPLDMHRFSITGEEYRTATA